MKKMYFSMNSKFRITMLIIIVWILIDLHFGYSWFMDMTKVLNPIYCVFVVLSLAIIPSVNLGLMICGVIFDKQRDYSPKTGYSFLPKVTILIAAYNEEKCIYNTLKNLTEQRYTNDFCIKVIDNASTDSTKSEIMRAVNDLKDYDIEYIYESRKGKFNALNTGLKRTDTEFMVTIDADTILSKGALYTIVNHINSESHNKKIGAVAGTILVRNSRVNLMTKLQEWEYFLSISGIKRSQGLFQATLVAQGAFSAYDTELLKSIGGWSDSIGEDIVLTWDILSKGYVAQFEPMAIAFTNVPHEYGTFFVQRARWARGMIEALKRRAFFKYPNFRVALLLFQDMLLPLIDVGVLIALWPGIIIAILFKNYTLFGPACILMLPMMAFTYLTLFFKEKKCVFEQLDLGVRKHYISFFVYLIFWNLIIAPAAVMGYVQELFHFKRRWK